MKKLQSLEALRATAAMLVVFFHVQMIFYQRNGIIAFYGLFGAGSRGVDLFFVLSGFIIMTVHGKDLGQASRVGNYIYNRVARIYPAVWIMTALSVAAYAIGFSGTGGTGKLSLENVLTSSLLLPQDSVALVNVTWTLKYEVFFYAIFALLIVGARLGVAVLAVWLSTVVVVAVTVPVGWPGWTHFYLEPIVLEFGIGMLCAVTQLRRPLKPGPLTLAILAAGLTLFLCGMAIETHTGHEMPRLISSVIFGGGAGLIVLGLTSNDRSWPAWIVYLGGASYAIYLVHFSFVALVAAAMDKLHLPVGNPIFFAVAMAAVLGGVVFHECVDKPIQSMLRGLKPHIIRLSALHVTSTAEDVYAGTPKPRSRT